MNVVADASPLIALAILHRLDLLDALFIEVLVPTAVYQEATQQNKPHASQIQKFIQDKVVAVSNQLDVQEFNNDVDLGEAEAIALALEKGIVRILIDDAKGRRFAQSKGLQPVGTIGVLLQAKRQGLVSEIKPLLQTLVANRIRISPLLVQQTLHLAGEDK
ncbi:MAG: DUF3368 domain-containing protein [Anaerolineae bacterium]|nr:DUF3368 domain-containing protein [Anaerolineae bacterium]